MPKKMTDAELLRVLQTEQDAAYHNNTGQSSRDRERSLRDYMRMPYGTELPGRSQVVASDVFDAVEGMLPDIVDVFVSSDKAVVFEPVGPEDEEAAEQVTNACNHVFYKQNNGFLLLYTAIKDGLMLKTGGVKWYWDEKRVPTFETKRGTAVQVAAYLAATPDAELIEQSDYEPPEEEVQQAQAQGVEIPPMVVAKIKTIKKKGKCAIVNVPADEFWVSKRHSSVLLDECPYVAHIAKRTLSEIRQLGFQDVTADDVKAAQDIQRTQDRELRDMLVDGQDARYNDETQDETQLQGWLAEEYILCDYDGDGVAERRRVIRLGDKILSNEEASHVQMAAWTPYILTHQFRGVSVADLVTDFQRIRTDIWRAQLDNLDLANNQETVVLTDSNGSPLANIDDVLNRRPGGVLREQVPNAIRPYNQRWQGIEAGPMLEYLEVAKENRTGYTRYSQGMDGDGLNKTATGVTKIMNASQKRMRLMARIVAEALVAPMFRGVFKTLQDYCIESLSFRLNGRFIQYDPQNWRDGYDMTINVGIGTGDQLQQQQHLMAIAQAQFMLMQSPMGPMLVDPVNVYEVQSAIAENAGFKNPGRFFSDPRMKPPPPPPPPDPKIQLEQAKMQADVQKFQAQAQIDREKEATKLQAQMAADQNAQEMQARQRAIELEQQASIDREKIASQERIKAAELEFQRWAKELDANMQIQAQQTQMGDLQGLKTQLAELMQDRDTLPEIERDQAGVAIAVRKGKSRREIVRGPDGKAMGFK